MQEKKNGSILIIIIVLIVLAGFFMWMGGDEEETVSAPEDTAMMDDMEDADAVPMAETGDTQVAGDMAKVGSYEPFSSEKLATADTKTVLFFKASWCPSCRSLDKALQEEAADIPEGVTILNVDYDSAGDLRKQYGVTTQHTLVQVDAEGNLVHKWSGSANLDAVIAQVK